MNADRLPPFEFFDVHVSLGRPNIPKYRFAEAADGMVADLAAVGIAGGLVRHYFGQEGHPVAGNRMLVDAVAGARGFEPLWAVMPQWTGEFAQPGEIAGQMRAAKARAAIAYPATQGFATRPTVMGPLLDALEVARIPLFLPAGEADLRAVEKIARRHPALPVVVMELAQASARDLYAMLDALDNVYVEISGFMLHAGIEDVCRRFGAERLIFGTHYPLYNPACAVAAVLYADISDGEKAKIAAGNAKRLLEEVRLG